MLPVTSLSRWIEPQCSQSAIVMAFFNSSQVPSSSNPALRFPNILSGTRMFVNNPSAQGLVTRDYHGAGGAYLLQAGSIGSNLSPSQSSFGIAGMAFSGSACPSGASSCSSSSCVCTGRYCQSTEPLSVQSLCQ